MEGEATAARRRRRIMCTEPATNLEAKETAMYVGSSTCSLNQSKILERSNLPTPKTALGLKPRNACVGCCRYELPPQPPTAISCFLAGIINVSVVGKIVRRALTFIMPARKYIPYVVSHKPLEPGRLTTTVANAKHTAVQ